MALGDKGEKRKHSRLESYTERMVATFSEIPPVFLAERISLTLFIEIFYSFFVGCKIRFFFSSFT